MQLPGSVFVHESGFGTLDSAVELKVHKAVKSEMINKSYLIDNKKHQCLIKCCCCFLILYSNKSYLYAQV